MRVEEGSQIGPLEGNRGEGANGKRDRNACLECKHVPWGLDHGLEAADLVQFRGPYATIQLHCVCNGILEIKTGKHVINIA